MQPCLQGSFEDFSIQDVLQLVSLDSKSGCLFLNTPAGGGTILFRKGRILSAVEDAGRPLGAGLAHLPGHQRDEAIRQRLVAFLDRLSRPRQGSFRFQSSEAQAHAASDRGLAPQLRRAGIDVIKLLLELAHRQEERRRPSVPPVLLVDDEEQVRRYLARCIVEAGYPVMEARDVESAVQTGTRLGDAGRRFVLVTDADMPLGNSFRGGFELVKRLARLRLKPPVVMMAHDASASLRAIPKRQAWSVVRKPGLSKLDPAEFDADMRALAARVVDEILPRLCS